MAIKNAIIFSGESTPATPTTGLFAWGLGLNQMGLGYTELQQVASDNDWDVVACGDNHGLAIKDGELYSWGYNASGKTGQGTITGYTTIPTKVGSYNDWWMVSAGYDHSLGIRKTWDTDHYDYTLWVWGEGNNYSTGMGATTDITTPTQVGSDTDWEWISAGYQWSCAVKGGKLYTCGINSSYRTGQNTSSGSTTTWTSYDDSTGWTKCFAGNLHGLGIKSGDLWTWGEGSSYRLGTGSTTDQPVPYETNTSEIWSHGSAGYQHSMMINTSGELFVAGEGSYYRLGNGSTTDVQTWTQIGTDTDWEQVKCNGNAGNSVYNQEFSYAIKGGKLYITGRNESGQCGFDPTTYSAIQTWTQLGDGTNYIDIGAGSGFGMACRQT